MSAKQTRKKVLECLLKIIIKEVALCCDKKKLDTPSLHLFSDEYNFDLEYREVLPDLRLAGEEEDETG